MTINCVFCGARFETETARYCSQRCRRSAWRLRQDGDTPALIDMDVPSVQEPRKDPYCGACLMCARADGEYQFTDRQARQRALVGLPACTWPHCGGPMMLESVVTPHHLGQVLRRRFGAA